MTLRELCERPVYHVQAHHTVLEAARYMTDHGVGAVAVLSGERLVGIFSERDLLNRVVVAGLDPATTPLRKAMTLNPVTITPETRMEDCMRIMYQAKCRHLPVLEKGHLVGMLSS